MRVLQIGSDRSKRGSIVPGTPAFARQVAYARAFGHLDDISFTLRDDGFPPQSDGTLSVYPTDSVNKFMYLFDAVRIAKKLQRPDAVSAQDPFEAGVVAWFIARRFRSPLYVQVHTDFLSPAYSRHSLLNRLRVLLAGFVLRRASGIRAVSEEIEEKIRIRYRLRAQAHTLPIYFDVSRFRDAPHDATLEARFAAFSKKLLYVGRLEPEKNVALALYSFASATPSDACLIVLGEGSERSVLENLAREKGIESRVFFEGARDPAAYYKLTDLVLLTSRYEGYPAVVAEALAAGKPILSTDVASARSMGAIIATQEDFSEALSHWFRSGPRTGVLMSNPYQDFDQYVRAYRDDIAACIPRK
jgi:glycosyltransferase involved in cell wall biosynthesis